jgi:unsaturated rhamnogalacturonyl hydrolase
LRVIDQKTVAAKLALVVGRLKTLQRPADEERLAGSLPNGGRAIGLYPRDFGMEAWDWPQGVGLYGLYQLDCAKPDPATKSFLLHWYAGHFRRGLPVRNINTTIPLLALSHMLDEMPPVCRSACRDWAEWLLAGLPKTRENGFQHTTTKDAAAGTINLNEGQLWIDTLFMTVLFLARMGRLTGDRRYLAEAVHQYLVHVKYLFEKRTGLFYHGWTFAENHNFGGVFWCRGNSWYCSSVVDFVAIMGEDLDAGVRDYLLDTYRAQAAALSDLQDASGLWHTVLDDPASYVEVSGSAGFAYGMLKGIRLGLLDKGYRPVAERAIEAILERIGPDGTVGQVSAGTAMGMDRNFYRNIIIAPMAYGQSLVIMALAESLNH